MPSPIAHGAVGYIVYRAFREPLSEKGGLKPWSRTRLLLVIFSLSLLPDLDVIPGIIFGDLEGFHNNIANSLVAGVLAALLVAGVMRFLGRQSTRLWFFAALLSYELHLLMDYFTAERGLMLLWPFETQRYVAPFMLFFGVHYSEGLLSVHHIWTAITELAFAIGLIAVSYVLPRLVSATRDRAAS